MADAQPVYPDLQPKDERSALVQRLDQYRAIAAAALVDVPWPAALGHGWRWVKKTVDVPRTGSYMQLTRDVVRSAALASLRLASWRPPAWRLAWPEPSLPELWWSGRA